MRFKGKLVEWNDDRGFGFIEPAGGGARVFCHISAFAVKVRRPVLGERLAYEISEDKSGRMRASQIRPADIKLTSKVARPQRSPAPMMVRYIVVALFFAGVVYLTVVGRLPWFAPMAYLALSLLAIFVYAFDKRAAMKNIQRIPEDTLHVFEIIGGWPGAWLAQCWLHHKSRKASFQTVFWLCVVLNVGGLLVYSFQDQLFR